ncbi:Protein-disulfide isomerase [Nocardioides scoriae]|uniref:Protein-disulfide isomerase n=1 Tax=Nocardioides scoriae TaxID=642780 RepID=A0A1H1LPB3_9ACTN|nr:thioredoxin domain-containing protein [Nocardioides scoriae]SDR76150.1 Protein-disulfide isomerase [Nocardioides scoriae]
MAQKRTDRPGSGRPDRTTRAAALQHEAATKERNRRLLVALAAVVVVCALVAGVVIFSGGDGSQDAPSADVPAAASGQALVIGPKDAAHQVVVYEDFLCPYCRELENGSRSFLQAGAAAGTVRVEYRPFHLLQDDYSERALNAWGIVLAQGTPAQALAFHDKLYDEQPYEAASSKPDDAQLADWAKDAGVSDGKVLDAIRSGTIDQQFVDAADATAEKAGVQGTPTVTLDGKPLEGSSISAMVDDLERAVATS